MYESETKLAGDTMHVIIHPRYLSMAQKNRRVEKLMGGSPTIFTSSTALSVTAPLALPLVPLHILDKLARGHSARTDFLRSAGASEHCDPPGLWRRL